MAGDINPPIGESGGEQLARDAKAALAREEDALKTAGKDVAAVEGRSDEVAKLRKRLTDAQRKALEPSRPGFATGGTTGTVRALDQKGLVDIVRGPGGGLRYTDLGRQVAGIEQQAAEIDKATANVARAEEKVEQARKRFVVQQRRQKSGQLASTFNVLDRDTGDKGATPFTSRERASIAADLSNQRGERVDNYDKEVERIANQRRRAANRAAKEAEAARQAEAAKAIVVTDANRAEIAPTLSRLTSHLPEVGEPGIRREQGIDRQAYELMGKQLPRSDIGLFTARDAEGKIIGALESYAPFLDPARRQTPEGKPVWQVHENAVAVDPAHRRQGIASQLFGAAEREGLDVFNPTHETFTDDGAALVNALKARRQTEPEKAAEEATQKQGEALARGVRKARVPAVKALTREQEALMQDYLNATGTAQAKLRKQLADQGVLGAAPIGSSRPPQKTSPPIGSPTYKKELAKALESPNFKFTSFAGDRTAELFGEAAVPFQGSETPPPRARPVKPKPPVRTDAISKQAAADAERRARTQADIERIRAERAAKAAFVDPGAPLPLNFRDERKAAEERAASARQEAADLHKAAVKAEGQAKSARTRARTLREKFVPAADQEAHAAKLARTESEVIPAAEARAAEALAARQVAAQRAQDATAEANAARRRYTAARDTPAADAQSTQKAEQAKTTAVEGGAAKRSTARKQEHADVNQAIGDSAKEVEAAAARNKADVDAMLARNAAHEQAAKAGTVPPVDSAEHQAAIAREQADAEAKRKALEAAPPPPPPPRKPPVAAAPSEPDPAAQRLAYARDRLGAEPASPSNRLYGPGTAAGRQEFQRQVAAKVRELEKLQGEALLEDVEREKARVRATGAPVTGNRLYGPGSAAGRSEFERQQRAQIAEARRLAAEEDAARTQALHGTDLIRHPTLYGTGPAGPFPGGYAAPTPDDQQRRAEYSALNQKAVKADDRQRGRDAERATKDQAVALRQSTVATSENEAVKARLAAAEARVAASQEGTAAGFQRSAVALGLSSQALTRHGYLTSEAIEAAKRGELTYKQWGQQITGTAAKFAGWTAVSIPVFAALAGVQAIGQGAIASASGVGKLQRSISQVDGNRLQSQFRDLSGKFNVPIADVTEAVARMGQVFKDQDSAVTGAAAALYAFKTGGVDVETGTRNLIAISNGFKLSANQILPLFDQINAAQNRFGVTVPDSLAGLAKASGAFANAGGSKDYLLSLIGTGKLVTGRTGENIGTAIQRSVGFLSRPKNQEELKTFGIDPTQGIESTYNQAFKKAQDLSGRELQRLATALSSPQYASYFVPILQNQAKFRQIQAGTSPAASKGASETELQAVLSQLDEQIKSIGTQLGLLGSNLVEGGFLTGLKLAVGTFSEILKLVNGILGVFNLLPGPLKTAVAVALQLRGLQAIARRVPGLGDAVAQGPLSGLAPYLQPSQTRTDAVQVRKGLNDTLAARRDEQERLDKEALRAQSELGIAQSVHTQTGIDVGKRVAAGTLSEADAEAAKLAATAELEAAERAVLRSTYRSVAAKQATVAAELELATAAEAEARAGEAGLVSYANERRVFAAAPGGPSTAPILRGGPGGLRPEGEQVGAPPVVPLAGQTPKYGEIKTAAQEAEAEAATLRGRATAFGQGVLRYSGTTRAVAATVTATGGAVKGALRGISGAVESVARGALTLGSALGPLDVALIAAYAGYEIVSHEIDRQKQLVAKFRTSVVEQSDPAKIEDYAKDTRKHDGVSGFVSGFVAQVKAKQLTNQQDQGFNLRISQIRDGLKSSLQGADGVTEQIGLVQQALTEAANSFIAHLPNTKANRGAKANLAAYVLALKGQLRDLQARGDQVTEAINSLSTVEDFTAFNESRTGRIGLRGYVGRKDPKVAALERIQAAKQLASGTSTPAQALKEIQDAEASVLEPAKKQLDDALAVARTPHQIAAAHAAYATTARGVQGVPNIKAALQQAQRRLLSLQKDLETAVPDQGALGALPGLSQGGIGGLLGKEAKRGQSIQSIRQSIRFQNGIVRALLRLLGVSTKNLAQINNEEAQTAYDAHAAQFDQNTELLISRQTTDSGKQTVAVQRARQKLARVNDGIKKGRAKVGDRVAAEIDLNNSLQQGVDQAASDAEAHFEAQIGLASARFAASGASDLAIAQRAVSDAQKVANHIASIKGSGSTEAITALTAVFQAKKALTDLADQQAKALIESVFGLAESKTDNPIKIDRLELQKAQRLVGQAKTPADRNDAQATVNRNKRQLEDDIANRKVDDLKYEEEIGKITTQQEIAGLRRIAATLKKGSELKRNLLRDANRLQHQLDTDNGLDLDLGNIKLPSAYEIKRFVKGERSGVGVTQAYNTTIVVNNPGDVNAVGAHVDKLQRGTAKSVARARGRR